MENTNVENVEVTEVEVVEVGTVFTEAGNLKRDVHIKSKESAMEMIAGAIEARGLEVVVSKNKTLYFVTEVEGKNVYVEFNVSVGVKSPEDKASKTAKKVVKEDEKAEVLALF